MHQKVLCAKCLKELEKDVCIQFKNGTKLIEIVKSTKVFSQIDGLSMWMRTQLGLCTPRFVKERFGSVSIIRNSSSISGETQYFTEAKQAVRELIAEETHKILHFPLRLISLPHVNMADIVEFANWCTIEPPKSLAVEKKRKWFNLISSWVNAASLLPDGHIINGLRVYNGKLSQALIGVPGVYNCVNFDFDGCLSREVYTSLQNLFTYQRLADDAVVFVTLADHIRFLRSPTTSKLITMPQNVLVPLLVEEFAKRNGYHSESLWNDGLRYKDNTRSPMLTLAFRTIKTKEVNGDDDGQNKSILWYPK
jgi:hypothetical protein